MEVLERELTATRESLQATVEELETSNEELQSTNEELMSSNEELQSSNEELQSVNEELQSTNEELETSKEELQSVNEELSTVNAELQQRVAELSRMNNDMNNLVSGTGIGTVFVDLQLRILRFTPAASSIINLIPTDVGRPVAHIVSNLLDYHTLVADVQAVLADGERTSAGSYDHAVGVGRDLDPRRHAAERGDQRVRARQLDLAAALALGQPRELLGVLRALPVGQLALGDILHDPLPEQRRAVLVAHDRGIVAQPHAAAVARKHAEFDLPGRQSRVGPLQLGQHTRALVRVDVLDPQRRGRQPLGLREAQDRLDLRADIDRAADRIERAGVRHQRHVLCLLYTSPSPRD